jgi:hypothetical protein
MQRHSRHSKKCTEKECLASLCIHWLVRWTIGPLDSSPNVLIQNTTYKTFVAPEPELLNF